MFTYFLVHHIILISTFFSCLKKSHPILNYRSSSRRSHSPYRHIRSLYASIYMYPSLPARTHRGQTLRKGCYFLNPVLPNISCPHKGREPFRIPAALVLAPRLCPDCHLWVCTTMFHLHSFILLFSYLNNFLAFLFDVTLVLTLLDSSQNSWPFDDWHRLPPDTTHPPSFGIYHER